MTDYWGQTKLRRAVWWVMWWFVGILLLLVGVLPVTLAICISLLGEVGRAFFEFVATIGKRVTDKRDRYVHRDQMAMQSLARLGEDDDG